MTFREIRDHKFKLLFSYYILQNDIEELFFNYFSNDPYEEEGEDVNEYTGEPKSHKNIHTITVKDKDDTKNVSDAAVEIQITDEQVVEDIKNKIKDIINKTPEIDEMIKESLEAWDINRVGKAELTIIRLAVYEMYYDDSIDLPVAINEAVELAKVYGDEKSTKFVNGVLSTINRKKNNEGSDNSNTTK